MLGVIFFMLDLVDFVDAGKDEDDLEGDENRILQVYTVDE